MSRIGKASIKINNVKIVEDKSGYVVTGPKGSLIIPSFNGFTLDIKEDSVSVLNKNKENSSFANWGLLRSLLNNAIKGVTEGYEKKLELVGVGYRASIVGKTLTLNVGFSHPVLFNLPEGIEATVEENTKVAIKGIDKVLVGQVSANIKKIRKPEPYKGKGIRYAGEYIRRKAGKSGKEVA